MSLEKQIGRFQERLADARMTVNNLAARGQDNIWMDDERESYSLAYQQITDELKATMSQLENVGTPEADELYGDAAKLYIQLMTAQGRMQPLPLLSDTAPMKFRAETAMKKGVGFETQLKAIQQQAPTIIYNYNYDNSKTIQTKDPGSRPRTGDLP